MELKLSSMNNLSKLSNTEKRIKTGECYLFCYECGSRLWSFNGKKDAQRSCPYRDSNGHCITPDEEFYK